MEQFLDAIQSGASSDDIANIPIPESYRACFVKRDEADMFEGLDSWDKDPRKSLHVDEVRSITPSCLSVSCRLTLSPQARSVFFPRVTRLMRFLSGNSI